MIAATMVVATIPVTDLERAKLFYGDVLALRLLSETPAGARYRCGAVSEISIFKRAPVATEHTLAHFEVDDIEARSPGPRGQGRRVPGLLRRSPHYHRPHRPCGSCAWRLVPRSRRQHPRASTGMTRAPASREPL